MTKQPFAAIDIGSNTFRLLIAHPSTGTPPWQTLHYTHRIVRLGEGLHHSGRLNDTAMQRGMDAFHTFASLLQQYNVPCEQVYAVATAAMREAANGVSFRDRVQRETGICIDIIDGEREAAMSLAGACAVLHADTRRDFLLFDIGGGSTEFIRAREGRALDAISCKLGVVRLVERFLHSDPPANDDYQNMIHATQQHLDDVAAHWSGAREPAHLVGTAGTVTTLAATELDLCPYDASIINNHVMSRQAFCQLRDRLLALNHAQRQAIRTIEQGRSDLIVAGLAIVEAVMQRWHYDAMIVVDAGLLEGAWLHISRQR